MLFCKICEKGFRDNYRLTRHLSRIIPCEGKKEEEKSEIIGIPSLLAGKEPLLAGKEPLNKCEFCLNTYSNKSNLKVHKAICKHREDPLRLLEIKGGINPETPPSKSECRFCNHNFFNVSKLNRHLLICKEREEYHQTLINKQTVQQQITNNVTINNNNINNNNNNIININVFGKESTDHVKAEKLIQMLRELSLEYNKDQVYLSAGEFINLVNRYIREIPENDNFSIPDTKGLYAEIKTSTGMEKVAIDRYLEKSFKSSAKTILDKKESINDHNERVFKIKKNNDMFIEVKGFAKDGFRHTPRNCVGTPRQIRSSYKIGMLKREEIDF